MGPGLVTLPNAPLIWQNRVGGLHPGVREKRPGVAASRVEPDDDQSAQDGWASRAGPVG